MNRLAPGTRGGGQAVLGWERADGAWPALRKDCACWSKGLRGGLPQAPCQDSGFMVKGIWGVGGMGRTSASCWRGKTSTRQGNWIILPDDLSQAPGGLCSRLGWGADGAWSAPNCGRLDEGAAWRPSTGGSGHGSV